MCASQLAPPNSTTHAATLHMSTQASRERSKRITLHSAPDGCFLHAQQLPRADLIPTCSVIKTPCDNLHMNMNIPRISHIVD